MKKLGSSFGLIALLLVGQAQAQGQSITIPPGVQSTGSIAANDCAKFTNPLLITTTGAACAGATAPGGSTTQLQYNNASAFGGISGWTTNGTTALTGGASTTVAIGGATIGSNALAVTGPTTLNESIGSSALTLTGATQTTSQPLINATQTWNAGAVTFTGWKLNVTDTTSAAASLLMDLQKAGVSQANVDKGGNVIFLGTGVFASAGTQINSFGLKMRGGSQIAWNSTSTWNGAAYDLILERDAAYSIGQRVGVNAQKLSIYNTFTDASNYERGVIDWIATANTLTIGSQAAGTGTVRPVNIVGAGVGIGVSGLTLTAGALAFPKITASASAPGAAGSKFEVVCGTNAGTAKLIMAAGTSATAVTVVDNVGAGVTGC